MSVWKLRQNNANNIALANYEKSYSNEITELVSITLVSITLESSVRFVSGNYVLKPYK